MGKKKTDDQVELQAKPEGIRFYRLVELPMKPDEAYRGYQPEFVEIVGDQVVRRELTGKPNLFEYAQTDVIDQMDPRNHVTRNKTNFA